MRNAIFSNYQPGGMFSVIDVNKHPGNVWFVDSGHSSASNSDGYGQNPDAPFATIDYAIGKCTANNGDVVYVMPGHTETLTGAAGIVLDVVGISIIGLGIGSDRPTITFSSSDNGANIPISAANIHIENILCVCNDDGLTAFITVSAADVTLKNIELRDSTDKEAVVGILTTAAADRLTVDGLYYNGYTSGDVCTIGIKLIGVDSANIVNSRFIGLFSTASIDMATTQCTKINVQNCVFLNTGTADLSKNVVDDVGGATSIWGVSNCFDIVVGINFSGSDTLAVAGDDVSSIIPTVNSYMIVQTTLDRSHMLVQATAEQSYTLIQGTADRSHMLIQAAADQSYTLVQSALNRSHMLVQAGLDQSYMKVEADANMSYMLVQAAAQIAADTSYMLVQSALDRSYTLVQADIIKSMILLLPST
jgi:hypothetical protein